MDHFSYRQGELYCENVPAADIAERFATPTVVYSVGALRERYRRFVDAFGPLGCRVNFSVSACPVVGCLRVLANEGAGMTACSGTELERAWLATAPMKHVLATGVGKADEDIRAALDGLYSPLFQAGATVDGRPPYYRGPVGRLSADSESELKRIAKIVTGLRISCRVVLRVDPELEYATDAESGADAPPPTGKFGIPPSLVPKLFKRYADDPRVRLTGLHMHVGPGLVAPDRFVTAATELCRLADDLTSHGHELDMLALGDGFPAGGHVFTPETYAEALRPVLAKWTARAKAGEADLVVEPGRAIAAGAAVLLARVRDVKPAEDRLIVVADAGTSPGQRPHAKEGLVIVWPARVPPDLEPPKSGAERLDTRGMQWCDVVGPSHSARDGLAEGRLMPPVKRGDLLAVTRAGASARDTLAPMGDAPACAEVIVDGFTPKLLRTRPGTVELIRPEIDAMHGTT